MGYREVQELEEEEYSAAPIDYLSLGEARS